jgi:Cd2+/Zn2+-exporting ATPase
VGINPFSPPSTGGYLSSSHDEVDATANVGIAMASAGSDVAVENADIAIMNDNIATIPYLVKLSLKMNGIIRFNTILAISIKAFFIFITILGMDNLVMAIMADVGLTIFVILNSLRLYSYDTVFSAH